MLDVLWPIHAFGFAPFALILALAALQREPERHQDLHTGYIVRGSLRATPDGYAFTLFDPKQGGCVVGLYEVTYDGPLPETVCDGADVAVYGELDANHEHLEAKSVIGFNAGRYDSCWRSRCLTGSARPDGCPRHLMYE